MYILFGLLVLREGISLEKLYLNIFLIDLINYLKLMVDANGHRAKTNVKKLIQLLISKKDTHILIPRERERDIRCLTVIPRFTMLLKLPGLTILLAKMILKSSGLTMTGK